MFMLYAPSAGKKHKGVENSSLLGLALLLINLLIDGATNSTQDEVFSKFKQVTGSQMMFWMNLFSTILTAFTLIVPLPPIPILSPPESTTTSELWTALEFIHHHPAVLTDIILFSLWGAVGQLFIFATLSSFGSLTLVTITVTRKLFTMLLSVFVFNHKLSLGQWLGVGMVFAGIGVEAYIKATEKKSGRTKVDRVANVVGEKARIKDI